jgi:hypothetical protein
MLPIKAGWQKVTDIGKASKELALSNYKKFIVPDKGPFVPKALILGAFIAILWCWVAGAAVATIFGIRIVRSRVLLWIMSTHLYRLLLKHIIPKIRFSMLLPSLRGYKYKRGYRNLKPGDILVTNDKAKLTSFLIPGEFAHAALCVAKGASEEFEVAEMTHHDYTHSTFFDLCKEADRVVIIRCADWDKEYTAKVIKKCISYDGVKYDSLFTYGVTALYCSELVTMSDFEDRLKVSFDDLVGMGKLYISPTGLYRGALPNKRGLASNKSKNCYVVWDSDNEK